MEKLKGKYEIILGFVTLIISLSAFKDELSKISINTGYIRFTLADYFLYAVCGFSACLYLYIVEHIVRDTKIGNWKIFDYIIRLAYFLFVFTLITPILAIVSIITTEVYTHIFDEDGDIRPHGMDIIKIIVSAIMLFFTNYISNLLREKNQNLQKEEIEEQQIKELDSANKLFIDGYFSHSALESYKAIETYLYKKIIEKGIRVQRNRFNELVKIARKENIINDEDLPIINDIREMRNVAAHTSETYTKQQAELALNFVRKLFQRSI